MRARLLPSPSRNTGSRRARDGQFGVRLRASVLASPSQASHLAALRPHLAERCAERAQRDVRVLGPRQERAGGGGARRALIAAAHRGAPLAAPPGAVARGLAGGVAAPLVARSVAAQLAGGVAAPLVARSVAAQLAAPRHERAARAVAGPLVARAG
eukprot:CAMPEP_0180068390 /NCGR_PEP_ID=MMETSP0985-20121206/10401_1 /TAXON_ID=483367 /ORGANISM="non described non described, Strain CCMP 2436" /LENGTH=155 /DNA_ID=CAMNT_0021999179 /DNA_START=116 /DNA_END=580 /DNA_ORIENTATION=-